MKKEVIVQKDPKSPISEVFRTLRTNLQFMGTSKGLKSLLITSTIQEEGKSWISSNLAVTFAQAGKRVILIDADMRKGRQYSIFGVAPKPGLSNYLSGIDDKNDISEYIRETEVENLYIIPAGNVPPNPAELLTSSRMPEMLASLQKYCDIIILDGPPALLVTDATLLSRYVDSTLIVAKYKSTKMDALQKVVKGIQNVGGKIAGVVLNKIPISQKEYNSTYYYGSSSAMEEKAFKMHTEKKQPRMEPKETLKTKTNTTIRKENNSIAEKETKIPKIDIENNGDVSLEKTDEILKQINQYLAEEKNRLKGEDKKHD